MTKELIMLKRRIVWTVAVVAAAVGLSAGAALFGLFGGEESHGAAPSEAAASGPATQTRSVVLSSDDPSARQVALMGQELASMRAELAAVRGQVDQARAQAEAAPKEEVEDESTRASRRAEGDAMHQARLASVDSAFRSEPSNPRWASGAGSSIRDALAAARIDASKLRNMECRSRTCRIELAEDEASDLSKTLPVFALQVGRALPEITADHVDNGQGRRTAVLYLSANP